MSEHAPHYVSRNATRVAASVVRLAAAYILAGAMAKLLRGTPADLPAFLRENAHGRIGLLFELIIAVEIFTSVAALLAPRLAWPVVSGLLLVFLVILGAQVSEGAASCGCFGSTITIPPWVMMAVDGSLVLAIFAVRPWRNLVRQGWRAWSVAVGCLAAVASSAYLGFFTEVPPEDLEANDPFAGRNAAPIPAVVGAPNLGVPGPTAAIRVEEPVRRRAWRLPEHLPRYVILEPDKWIGRRLSATNLATWADVSKFPTDASVVFYYDTCKHCAEHLRELADAEPPEPCVLIQLPNKPASRHPVVVDRVPEGLHVQLPSGTRWMIQTPWEVTVRDGRVVAAEYLGE